MAVVFNGSPDDESTRIVAQRLYYSKAREESMEAAYLIILGIALAVMVIFYLASRKEEKEADRNIGEIRKLERLREGLAKQEIDADLLPTLMEVMADTKGRLDKLEQGFAQRKLASTEIQELVELRVSFRIMQITASKHAKG